MLSREKRLPTRLRTTERHLKYLLVSLGAYMVVEVGGYQRGFSFLYLVLVLVPAGTSEWKPCSSLDTA